MAYSNPDKVAPIDGELNPEEFLDFIIKHNDGENPQFGIASELRKKLGGALSLLNKHHNELLHGISKLMFQYGYGKSQDKTNEFYDVCQPWKDAHKMGGHFQYQKNINQQKTKQEEKENLEMLKLRYEVDDLTNRLLDYDSTKRRSVRSEKIAILAVIVTVIGLVLQWLLGKNVSHRPTTSYKIRQQIIYDKGFQLCGSSSSILLMG